MYLTKKLSDLGVDSTGIWAHRECKQNYQLFVQTVYLKCNRVLENSHFDVELVKLKRL